MDLVKILVLVLLGLLNVSSASLALPGGAAVRAVAGNVPNGINNSPGPVGVGVPHPVSAPGTPAGKLGAPLVVLRDEDPKVNSINVVNGAAEAVLNTDASLAAPKKLDSSHALAEISTVDIEKRAKPKTWKPKCTLIDGVWATHDACVKACTCTDPGLSGMYCDLDWRPVPATDFCGIWGKCICGKNPFSQKDQDPDPLMGDSCLKSRGHLKACSMPDPKVVEKRAEANGVVAAVATPNLFPHKIVSAPADDQVSPSVIKVETAPNGANDLDAAAPAAVPKVYKASCKKGALTWFYDKCTRWCWCVGSGKKGLHCADPESPLAKWECVQQASCTCGAFNDHTEGDSCRRNPSGGRLLNPCASSGKVDQKRDVPKEIAMEASSDHAIAETANLPSVGFTSPLVARSANSYAITCGKPFLEMWTGLNAQCQSKCHCNYFGPGGMKCFDAHWPIKKQDCIDYANCWCGADPNLEGESCTRGGRFGGCSISGKVAEKRSHTKDIAVKRSDTEEPVVALPKDFQFIFPTCEQTKWTDAKMFQACSDHCLCTGFGPGRLICAPKPLTAGGRVCESDGGCYCKLNSDDPGGDMAATGDHSGDMAPIRSSPHGGTGTKGNNIDSKLCHPFRPTCNSHGGLCASDCTCLKFGDDGLSCPSSTLACRALAECKCDNDPDALIGETCLQGKTGGKVGPCSSAAVQERSGVDSSVVCKGSFAGSDAAHHDCLRYCVCQDVGSVQRLSCLNSRTGGGFACANIGCYCSKDKK